MKQHDNFHSTAVAWLKVGLPLLALAILSTLFLVARTIDPSAAIPFAEVDIEDRIREPRLTQPTWAGVTDDGVALTIAASEARPQQDNTPGASANTMIVDLAVPDGSSTRLQADQGILNTAEGVLTLDGAVTISTSNGYELTSDAMRVALDRTSLISKTPVAGTAPGGTLTAGAMELRENPDLPGAYLLVFKTGVRLLYTPAGQ